MNVPLLDIPKMILEKYKGKLPDGKILPIISNQKLNAYLKEIADVCGVKKNLTFHLARHTFATTTTLAKGVPIETVSKMLGHTNIETTQIYARITNNKISNDMQQYIKREFLTPEEKKLIVKVKLPIARLDRVRDIFLFSCFTGLTFDDVDKLQEYNIEILENGKRQMKIYIPLSNKIREIPLLAIPCLILDKYKGKQSDGKLLPLSCKAAFNHNLKEIARLCGINRNLTFHLARHTFIGTVTVANGISLKTVADILGHTQLNCIRSFIEPTNDKVQEDMAILSEKFRKIEKLFNT